VLEKRGQLPGDAGPPKGADKGGKSA
jgi:hypothetical protein